MSKFSFRLMNDLDGKRGLALNGRTFKLERTSDGCIMFIDAITGKKLMKSGKLIGVYSGQNEASITTMVGEPFNLVLA